MLMPGMLTPDRWPSWTPRAGHSSTASFTFMIQHHRGALTMVAQFSPPPAPRKNGPDLPIRRPT